MWQVLVSAKEDEVNKQRQGLKLWPEAFSSEDVQLQQRVVQGSLGEVCPGPGCLLLLMSAFDEQKDLEQVLLF